jgi:CheY-like chemotaxis protein
MAKILICDDNENNRDLIIDLLENSELEIFEAENGKQAVQYATEFLPDLILMDLKMPEIDGYEATKILKNNKATAKIPIIALSASATMINQSSIENNLFSATIIKPINIYQLIKSLKLFLKFSELEIDNKTESQKDEILIMTKEMLKSMPEAISTLETYFLPESLKAVEEQNIDKIEIFAKKIIAFGEKFSLNTIICFGNELSSYAENFEIDKISEAMAGFKSIINNIKSTFEEMRRSE